MAKYLVVYRGGNPDAEMDGDVTAAWMDWFASLDGSVLDMGNPFSASASLDSDGTRSTQTAGLSGYSLIEAESLDAAADALADCPQLAAGGSVEVYEAVAI